MTTEERSVERVVPVGSSPTVDSELFKSAFRNHPAGVAVVTADAGDGPVAMTATSVISISAVPPLLAFSASAMSTSTATICAAEFVVVHLLGESDSALAKLCATSGVDRFADAHSWFRLPSGETVFRTSGPWLLCRVIQKLNAGTSTLLIVEALEVCLPQEESAQIRRPLVYHDRTWHAIGDASRL